MSRTRKTVMAHGIANELNRKLLLINFPSLYSDSKTTEMLLNMTFREAKFKLQLYFLMNVNHYLHHVIHVVVM